MHAVIGQARPVAMLAQVIKHGADDALVDAQFGIHARRIHQITGQLLTQKRVEADIAVERTNEVVAVLKGSLGGNVPLVAVGVGVPHRVHPVASETFAKVW